MVALILSLKLRLQLNSLRQSTGKTVGTVLLTVVMLGFSALAALGLGFLRVQPLAVAGSVTTVVFAIITAGWLLSALTVFGTDETLDPARFALLPVRARSLMPGFVIASVMDITGVSTLIVIVGVLVAWTRTPLLSLSIVIAAAIGLLTCVLGSRLLTSALAKTLAGRKFRDLAAILIALSGASIGIGASLVGELVSRDPGAALQAIDKAAVVAGWTPFGWAWSIPGELAAGRNGTAAARLVLALALTAVLWFAWQHYLDRALTSPVETGGGGGSVRASSALDRLLPAGPAGAVAGRCVRYWRRDPRYLASLGAMLIIPLIVMVNAFTGTSTDLADIAPALVAILFGVSISSDLAYDGSALSAHVLAGLRGKDDRAGRAIVYLSIGVVMVTITTLVSVGVRGAWSALPGVIALDVVFLLGSVGVGLALGTVWPGSAPPPGQPFGKGSGGMENILLFTVTTIISLVLAAPILVLVLVADLDWLALALACLIGPLVLIAGIRWGGRRLEQRYPEVLTAVSG